MTQNALIKVIKHRIHKYPNLRIEFLRMYQQNLLQVAKDVVKAIDYCDCELMKQA